MPEVVHGFPAPMPFGIDFVNYSNEDLGRTAAFAAGLDNFQLALPYPSSMNLWEESMMVYCIEFIQVEAAIPRTALTEQGGEWIWLSMLDDAFGANWSMALGDNDDEAMKTKFAGPMYYGETEITALTSAAGEIYHLNPDRISTIKYYPPEPLDLVTPLYITWTNGFANYTLVTGVGVQDDDADKVEGIFVRVWFLKRNYTAMELMFLQRLPTRFQQLDS